MNIEYTGRRLNRAFFTVDGEKVRVTVDYLRSVEFSPEDTKAWREYSFTTPEVVYLSSERLWVEENGGYWSYPEATEEEKDMVLKLYEMAREKLDA